MCFRVTTQMYNTIRVFVLGPGTHTLLHVCPSLRVAVALYFIIRMYINNFNTLKASSHRNYSQSSGPHLLYWH